MDPRVVEAAQQFARGRPTVPPASLRVYALSKALRHLLVDPMDDYDLFRELECYAAAEQEQARRENAAQARRRGPGPSRR